MKNIKKALLALGIILASQAVYHKAAAVITDTDVQTISAVGNGATTSYTIGFQFQANSELRVYLQTESTTPYTRTLLVYGAGAGKYTFAAGDPTTAVVLGTAPTSSQRVIIKRVTSLTQQVDYVETDAFPAENHEEQMDRMEQSLQELDSAVGYKIGLSTVSTYATPTFPDPVADKWAVYEHTGGNLTLGPSGALTTGDVPQYIGTGWSTYNVTNGVIAGLAAHIADVANPHVVTATQVGKDTAQWNANKLKGVTIDDASIGQGKVLTYNSSSGNLEYVPGSLLPVGGASTVVTVNAAGTDIEYAFIDNDNVAPSAGIVDTKLATISTASKVSNSATTATASNTMSAIMARDASGQVAASTFTGNLVGNVTGNVTGAVTGNASTATALAANGTNCGASSLAEGVSADGSAECRQVDNTSIAAAAGIAANKLAAVTASRAVVSDGSGFITAATTTATEIGYVNGVTSAIQTQLNALSAGASTVQSYEISNVGITATVGSSALTIGLTQADGSACSSGSAACKIGFRSSTAATGQFVQRSITSAPSSLVISNGSTLGTTANVTHFVHVYAIDRGGSGVSIAAMGASTILDEGSLQNVLAEGGAGAADTVGQLYATTSAANIPVRLIGRLSVSQSAAGVWASAPTVLSLQPVSDSEYTGRVKVNASCTSTPCAITSQSKNWVGSITRASAGNYTVNYTAFSGAPTCNITPQGNTAAKCYWLSAISATAANMVCYDNTTTLVDTAFEVICMGPR